MHVRLTDRKIQKAVRKDAKARNKSVAHTVEVNLEKALCPVPRRKLLKF